MMSHYGPLMPRTLYDVMMVSHRADTGVITAVYRHLAKRYHPDVDPSPVAAARMAELNEAYAVLSDHERRARYDEILGMEGPEVTRESPGAHRASAPLEPQHGEAGPPPGTPAPTGRALTFGRYRGWTLNQIERYDRDYIEWLARTTMGRNYRQELEQLLRRRA